MSRLRYYGINIGAELRNHRLLGVGTMIGFLIVSMPAAWLLSMFAR